MIFALALVTQLSVAHLSPATSSARLLPAAATEYKAHAVWAPFAVGGLATVGGGLVVLATMMLVRGDVWTTVAIGAVGALAGIAILVVCSVVAIAFAIDNAAHKADPKRTVPANPPPEFTRVIEPGSAPPSTVVFRF